MMEIECLARIGIRKEKFALEGQYQEIMQGFTEKEYQERLIIMNLTTIEKKVHSTTGLFTFKNQ